MPKKGYKQTEEHREKHLVKISGASNGKWGGKRNPKNRIIRDTAYRYKVHLKEKYGMTESDYYKLYNLQNGRCAICGLHQEKLFVDHCHQDNKIRGLLCRTCNSGIGMLKDSIDILASAIDYLKNK